MPLKASGLNARGNQSEAISFYILSAAAPNESSRENATVNP